MLNEYVSKLKPLSHLHCYHFFYLYIRFDPHAGMRKIKAVNEFSTMGKFQYNKYIAMH